jgi:hypothetical protein
MAHKNKISLAHIILIMFLLSCNSKVQKPAGLPNDAEWIGGQDGGIWMFFNGKQTDSLYEFENGELWTKGLW